MDRGAAEGAGVSRMGELVSAATFQRVGPSVVYVEHG
jgi:hypothetical protein